MRDGIMITGKTAVKPQNRKIHEKLFSEISHTIDKVGHYFGDNKTKVLHADPARTAKHRTIHKGLSDDQEKENIFFGSFGVGTQEHLDSPGNKARPGVSHIFPCCKFTFRSRLYVIWKYMSACVRSV